MGAPGRRVARLGVRADRHGRCRDAHRVSLPFRFRGGGGPVDGHASPREQSVRREASGTPLVRFPSLFVVRTCGAPPARTSRRRTDRAAAAWPSGGLEASRHRMVSRDTLCTKRCVPPLLRPAATDGAMYAQAEHLLLRVRSFGHRRNEWCGSFARAHQMLRRASFGRTRPRHRRRPARASCCHHDGMGDAPWPRFVTALDLRARRSCGVPLLFFFPFSKCQHKRNPVRAVPQPAPL